MGAVEEELKQPIEIERKWLIAQVPENLDSYPHQDISQGYLAITQDKTEVRLRDRAGQYTQTVKVGQGLVRGEYETPITAEQYAILWPATAGKRLEKTRYEIEYEGVKIELDIYKGDLTGLVSAEVEFKSEEASTQFTSPEWFGDEVTTNSDYKNQNLATQGLPSSPTQA